MRQRQLKVLMKMNEVNITMTCGLKTVQQQVMYYVSRRPGKTPAIQKERQRRLVCVIVVSLVTIKPGSEKRNYLEQ
jgi:hypothetical protein